MLNIKKLKIMLSKRRLKKAEKYYLIFLQNRIDLKKDYITVEQAKAFADYARTIKLASKKLLDALKGL